MIARAILTCRDGVLHRATQTARSFIPPGRQPGVLGNAGDVLLHADDGSATVVLVERSPDILTISQHERDHITSSPQSRVFGTFRTEDWHAKRVQIFLVKVVQVHFLSDMPRNGSGLLTLPSVRRFAASCRHCKV